MLRDLRVGLWSVSDRDRCSEPFPGPTGQLVPDSSTRMKLPLPCRPAGCWWRSKRRSERPAGELMQPRIVRDRGAARCEGPRPAPELHIPRRRYRKKRGSRVLQSANGQRWIRADWRGGAGHAQPGSAGVVASASGSIPGVGGRAGKVLRQLRSDAPFEVNAVWWPRRESECASVGPLRRRETTSQQWLSRHG